MITNGWAYVDFDILYPSGYDIENNLVVVLKDKKHQEIIINFWNEIDRRYQILSDTEILLWRKKDKEEE